MRRESAGALAGCSSTGCGGRGRTWSSRRLRRRVCCSWRRSWRGGIGRGRCIGSWTCIPRSRWRWVRSATACCRGRSRRLMGWCYRRAARVVALDEDMAARLRPYGVESRSSARGFSRRCLTTLAAARETGPQAPWTWIYSGNLGRAHEWETLLAAQALLEQRGAAVRLLFQGGGPSRPAAEARARELGLRRLRVGGTTSTEEELPASLLRAPGAGRHAAPRRAGAALAEQAGARCSACRGRSCGSGPTMARSRDCCGRVRRRAFSRRARRAESRTGCSPGRERRAGSRAARLDPAAHRDAALAAWSAVVRALDEPCRAACSR